MRRYVAAALFIAVVATSARGEDMVIRARFLDADGRSLPGAELFLYSGSDVRRPADFISPKGGADGRAEVRVPSGRYAAVARLRSGDRYGPLGGRDRHSGDPVVVEPAPAQELEFPLYDIRDAARRRQKGEITLRRLSVKIVDPEGRGVAAVYVTARTGRETSTLPAYFSTATDVAGTTFLHLPEGEHAVSVWTAFPPAGSPAAIGKVAVGSDEILLRVPTPESPRLPATTPAGED